MHSVGGVKCRGNAICIFYGYESVGKALFAYFVIMKVTRKSCTMSKVLMRR